MMDCGKQAAKLSLSRWFRVPTIAEWEAETNITNSGFDKLKLVVAVVGTIQSAQHGRPRGLLESTVSGGATLRIASSSADRNPTTRKRRGSTLPQRLEIYFFFFLWEGFIDVAPSGRIY
jgi:hypothetical protein